LGQGSYGDVRLIIHRQSGVHRSLKIISKLDLEHIEETEKEIISEINLLMQLDHPNIINLFEYFQDSKHFYVVGELLKGGDLHSYIKRHKKIRESKAR
jgi:calcium-dependent protein kinase